MSDQASRDGPTNKVRARMSIASAMIFGSIFWRMGRSQTSIQDRMGLLQVNPAEFELVFDVLYELLHILLCCLSIALGMESPWTQEDDMILRGNGLGRSIVFFFQGCEER